MSADQKHAYVTVLTTGDNYLDGVLVLGKSLDASGSTKDRLVLCTSDVSESARQRLRDRGWKVTEVEPIANPSPENVLYPRFANVFTKLRVWQVPGYDRLVYLDADTLILKNVDDLFERHTFAAGPDFFLPDRFNSGVMVLDPSEKTFASMMDRLASVGSYDGGDQGFLNIYFENWYGMDVNHRLPVGYNMANFIYQFMHGNPSLKLALEKEAKIIHYMVQKPWMAKTTLTGGAQAWWQTYFELYPEKAHSWADKIHAFEDWTFDHLCSLMLS